MRCVLNVLFYTKKDVMEVNPSVGAPNNRPKERCPLRKRVPRPRPHSGVLSTPSFFSSTKSETGGPVPSQTEGHGRREKVLGRGLQRPQRLVEFEVEVNPMR